MGRIGVTALNARGLINFWIRSLSILSKAQHEKLKILNIIVLLNMQMHNLYS